MIREFKVLTLCAIFFYLVFNAAAVMAKPKWQVLFAGKSTDAWRGFRRDYFPSKCWAIENGSLKTIAGCAEADRVDLVTKVKYQNFELELEWRVAPGGTIGLLYPVPQPENQGRAPGLE